MASAKKTLVIVESPSKAKTIGKYLGSRYKVMASKGHVRDLPKSRMGIEIDNNFEPDYITVRGQGPIIKDLKKEAKKASKIYLAADPDREGEAISWHLAYILGIDPETPCRIEFNEITKATIKDAVKNPRPVDMSLVDAQQARRTLDRLVGYSISPILWKKVRRGLSAGRVQSAALKILCDREREIENFVPEEYWNISADFKKGKKFNAKLALFDGKKITVHNKEEADKIRKDTENADFKVDAVSEKERKQNPRPPFITSSMQQEASTRLGFTPGRTMATAQQLYEGVRIDGKGTTGLITYMRTDSVRVSESARIDAKDLITEKFGDKYTANNYYKSKKGKEIQDAHEAIRPAVISLDPESIKSSLTRDQYKLYGLIWRRFIASQMAAARFYNKNIDLKAGKYTFRAKGSELIFDGYRAIYNGYRDSEGDTLLPPLSEGETLKSEKIITEQAFTKPPARYTEASLIKELEEDNIGRPSTYAPIVGKLSQRKYVEKEQRSFKVTELGFIVNDILEEYFDRIVDIGFTATMEDRLDEIELKDCDWKKIIADFYEPFSKELKRAEEEIKEVEIEEKPTGELCEKCGKPLVIKHGRFGAFIACSGYPDCKNTKPFIKKTGVKCPECGGDLIERRSKKGRIFFGCSNYPKCKNTYWNKPVDKKCPDCGSLMTEKKTKTTEYQCSNKECGYKE